MSAARPFNSKRQAHCEGKARFASPALARRRAVAFCRPTRRHARRTAVAYRCEYCGGWYLAERGP
ncbi:MAG: hypothetical protein IVW56_09490 [Candidatus Binataceae bacterium]|nr:hypothetical protein [Candidatus Binataceae bacterium]